MLYSIVNKERVKATPNTKGTCPFCGQETISKCGSIKIWHWAHKTACPYETEPMTEWHLNWQLYAESVGCTIEERFENHIADIVKPNLEIIEVQHSPISTETLLARCEYYKKENIPIHWIFDLRDKYSNDDVNIASGNHPYKEKEKINIYQNGISYRQKASIEKYMVGEQIYNILQENREILTIKIKRQSNVLYFLFVNNVPKYGRVFLDFGDNKRQFEMLALDQYGIGLGKHIDLKKLFV